MHRGYLRSLPNSALLVTLISVLFVLTRPTSSEARRENLVYFPNTPYQLNVYKIYGRKPGNTLMLIGGIQGNEPGGFLSADLYADMSLLEGNLLVVPRANFYSILLNHRGAHGDMNRKFAGEPKRRSMDDKIVSILKKLIAESDYLLNLHDGSGYYYPRYISRWRNPRLFGQSIIADYEQYTVPGQNRVLLLGEMARRVVEEINQEIDHELYRFHFNNTRTNEPESIHKEQLKSATYYALTHHHIPAFGIETSKFLPSIDLKVRYHNLAINVFMKLFGIIPEEPPLFLDPPELKYLVVSINGQIPIVVEKNQALEMTAGDTINIVHVEANYERGLSVDILGYGSLNDFGRDFPIYKSTTVVIRKDNKVFSEIPIRIHEGGTAYVKCPTRRGVSHFVIEVNGRYQILKRGETLDVVRGDLIRIRNILPERLAAQQDLHVNFKGFVGNWKNNTGEDRGYLIDTGKDLLARYALYGKKRVYRIVAVHGRKALGQMLVNIAEPSLEYLILRLNDRTYALKDRETILAAPNDYLTVMSTKSNIGEEKEIRVKANGYLLSPGYARRIKEIARKDGKTLRLDVTRKNLFLGNVYIDLIEPPAG